MLVGVVAADRERGQLTVIRCCTAGSWRTVLHVPDWVIWDIGVMGGEDPRLGAIDKVFHRVVRADEIFAVSEKRVRRVPDIAWRYLIGADYWIVSVRPAGVSRGVPIVVYRYIRLSAHVSVEF